MRKRIYQIIELSKDNDRLSLLYDWFILFTIILSIFPLTVKSPGMAGVWIDSITAVIFIIDYILRLVTADYKVGKKKWSFIIYPFTPMALIDLAAILPSVFGMANGFRLLKILRLPRTLRVFRVFKLLRYSRSFARINMVFRKQKEALTAVCILVISYVLVIALIIFSVEPESFTTFFDALYWAVVSLTTVGYGDLYPVTVTGRVVTIVSSLFGIAVIALPSGIITAGYMEELKAPQEVWDAYYPDGTYAGRDLIKGQHIPEEYRHAVAEIFVMHKDGSILLMQRDYGKQHYPGFWESGAGGSVLKGESFEEGAQRKLLEETGIAADTFTPNYTVVTHNTIYKGYVTIIDMAKDSIVLQKGETVAYRWVEKEEFLKILESNQFVPARRKRLEGFVAEL